MKPTHVALAVVAAVATVAAVVFATLYFTKASESEPTAASQACADRIFGHIASLKAESDTYELRFDPAWFTSGVTANTAAAGGASPNALRAGGASRAHGPARVGSTVRALADR